MSNKTMSNAEIYALLDGVEREATEFCRTHRRKTFENLVDLMPDVVGRDVWDNQIVRWANTGNIQGWTFREWSCHALEALRDTKRCNRAALCDRAEEFFSDYVCEMRDFPERYDRCKLLELWEKLILAILPTF